jgi:hypothetical protein
VVVEQKRAEASLQVALSVEQQVVEQKSAV